MKKTISIFLLMCFSLSLMGMASAETGSNEATIKGQILAYTEDWFTDNFSEHYDISDYEASVNNFQQSGAEIYAEIAACAVTTLKYNSVEELPYREILYQALLFETIRWNFMNGGDRYGIIPVLRTRRVREHACSSYA